MKDFTLYTVPQSRGGMVLWMLEECGADYDTVVLSYDSVKSPDYLAVNPMGKVPALKHRGQVLTESAAIVTYLAEQGHLQERHPRHPEPYPTIRNSHEPHPYP